MTSRESLEVLATDMAFVDLAKAFDTANRDLLWNILRKFGCSTTFIAMLQQFNAGMCSQVVMTGSQSSSFPVDVGVKQGCVLAPISLNLHKNSKNVSYLGSNLSFSGDLTNEIQRRINLASSAFGRLIKLCSVTKISRYTQRLLSIMQSLSPPSYMATTHESHTVVIPGYWSLFTSDVSS